MLERSYFLVKHCGKPSPDGPQDLEHERKKTVLSDGTKSCAPLLDCRTLCLPRPECKSRGRYQYDGGRR